MIDYKIEDNCYVNDKFIGTTVSKKITVNIINPNNELNLENKEIQVYAGIHINDKLEEVPFGNFIIEKPTDEEVKAKTSFTGYDYMVKFNILYDDSKNIYPKKLKDLFKDLCLQVGLEAGSLDFVNADYQVLGNPFTNNEDCRTVLSAIAQLAGGFAEIGRDNKVYIISLANRSSLLKVKDVHKMTVAELTATPVKMLGTKLANNGEVVPEESIDGNNYFEDFSKNNKWGEVNSVVLRLSGTEGENTVLQDNNSIEENGLTEIVIEDNPFLISQREREKVIAPLWNALKGISYIPFKTKYYGYPYLDVGDMLEVTDIEDRTYYTYVFNHTFEYNGSFSGELDTQAMTKTQTAYKNTFDMKTRFKNTERRIDKINGEISDIVEEQTDFSKKLTEHKQDIDSITDEVDRIYDFTKTIEGTNELLLEDCLPTNILKFELFANTVKAIYPSKSLFPSKRLFAKKGGTTITVVVGRTSRVVTPDPILPSKKLFPSKKLLPRSNGYYKKEYSFYVATPLRHYNDTHDKFIIEVDQENGMCVAKVLRYIKIDYVTGAITVLENPIEEIIGETQLELYKGNNYVYIKEFTDWKMKATYMFNNELNKWYAPRVETNSKIKRTTDEISMTVSKKVGKDEVISSINLSPEEAKIKSKNLELEGYTTINGGFSIDEKGNASIANKTVLINDKGIQMKDGATLVGGKGLLTNLQYTGLNHAYMDYSSQGDFGYIGYWVGEDWETSRIYVNKSYTTIIADIPANFSIELAYITLIHRPIVGDYPISESSLETKKIIGTSRNIGLYKGSLSTYVTRDVSYSNFSEIDLDMYSEIDGAFGRNGWTPYIATDTDSARIETTRSLNIAKDLKAGEVNKLKIETRDNLAIIGKDYYETEINMAPYSGMILPILNVYGFLKLE